jgi:hypothetical protein
VQQGRQSRSVANDLHHLGRLWSTAGDTRHTGNRRRSSEPCHPGRQSPSNLYADADAIAHTNHRAHFYAVRATIPNFHINADDHFHGSTLSYTHRYSHQDTSSTNLNIHYNSNFYPDLYTHPNSHIHTDLHSGAEQGHRLCLESQR